MYISMLLASFPGLLNGDNDNVSFDSSLARMYGIQWSVNSNSSALTRQIAFEGEATPYQYQQVVLPPHDLSGSVGYLI